MIFCNVSVNVNNRFIQRRVMNHLYCTVCQPITWYGQVMSSGWLSLLHCVSADNVVWSGDVEWLTVNEKLMSTGNIWDWCTAVVALCTVIALWLPVCSRYVLGHRASAIPHAASVTSRGRTCVPVTRRAASFSTYCSLSVIYLGDPAKTALQ